MTHSRWVLVPFVSRLIAEKPKEVLYSHQRKYIQCSGQESTEPGYVSIKELAEAMCRYDLDDMDLYWLQALNRELDRMGENQRDACVHDPEIRWIQTVPVVPVLC